MTVVTFRADVLVLAGLTVEVPFGSAVPALQELELQLMGRGPMHAMALDVIELCGAPIGGIYQTADLFPPSGRLPINVTVASGNQPAVRVRNPTAVPLQCQLLFIGELRVAGPEAVLFAHNGASFAPQIVAPTATWIEWRSEGYVIEGDASPTMSWGTAEPRQTELRVLPAGAVEAINLGYDGSDGGSTSAVVPSLVHVGPQQNVTGLDLSAVRSSLRCLTLSYNVEITALDLSGFAALERLEAFNDPAPNDGQLEVLDVSGCSAMRRLCIENCSVNALDLSAAPGVEDIRGANNALTTVLWHPGVLAALWHICIRNIQDMASDAFPDISRLPAIVDLYVSGTGRSGVYALAGGFPPGRNGDVWLGGNPALTGVTLENCDGIVRLLIGWCGLDSAAVDYVLVTLDSFGTSNGEVSLEGNGVPGPAGVAAAAALTSRGWTVGHA